MMEESTENPAMMAEEGMKKSNMDKMEKPMMESMEKSTTKSTKIHNPSPLTLFVSCLTHLLFVAPVLYIIIVALVFMDISLFTWHPVCMSLGAGLLIVEAVFAISGEAIMFSRVSRVSRVRLHWILHLIGIILLGIGFVVIVVNKETFNPPRNHFQTTHSLLGLITLIFTVFIAAFGIFANNTKWLYPHIRPVTIKILHAFAGICVTVLLLVTFINGTFKHWLEGYGGDAARGLILAAIFVGGFLVLIRPIIGAATRCRVLFKGTTKQEQDNKKMAMESSQKTMDQVDGDAQVTVTVTKVSEKSEVVMST